MTPDVAPVMRVSYMRETVGALATLGPIAESVRARCSAEIARIDGASRLSFLPVDDDLAILKAVEDLAGTAGVRLNARAALLSGASGPLLRPIRDAALMMLGATPAGIFRWAPQAWKLVFRNCGALSWTTTDRGGLLVLSGVPPGLDCSAWAEAAAGAFEGGFELAGNSSGTVDVEHARAEFRFHLKWTQPG